MNRNLIARKLAEKMSMSLVDSRVCVDTVVSIMVEGLLTDEKVTFHGFGRIFLLSQKPRAVRNPRTGESMMFESRDTIRLKPSKELIDKINKRKRK
ncbi:HU family DNA-binding protein [Parabacteroides faecis]|uniref:HU family DNA-binding protein n=1 Tax=Parabacteroides TaxID=375288 RepID=UPI000F005D37|nr:MULTISPECIES: HU family DNA-binding protein [Parabacteroides]MBC8620162.1 HU family DNA-binding protein [Parabacteroides faecis]RHS00930.1 HU family DNA-binding protein [Parabacteroides sp. AF14-59]